MAINLTTHSFSLSLFAFVPGLSKASTTRNHKRQSEWRNSFSIWFDREEEEINQTKLINERWVRNKPKRFVMSDSETLFLLLARDKPLNVQGWQSNRGSITPMSAYNSFNDSTSHLTIPSRRRMNLQRLWHESFQLNAFESRELKALAGIQIVPKENSDSADR